MSYRAFKRLLGETSLERKCRFLLGTVSVALITGSFWFYAHQTENVAINATANSCRLLVPQVLYNRHVAALQGKDAKQVQAAMERFQELWEKHGSKALSTYQYNFIKPDAKNPADSAEPDEAPLLARFMEKPLHNEETRQLPTGESFYYYGGIRLLEECRACHYTKPEEYADLEKTLKDRSGLMAVVRIKLSGTAIEEDVHRNRALLIAFAIATSLLIMTVSYLMIRYVVVKPVKHLKDVSDAIAAGELNVRSDIQTGDEFEDLSYAFNRMLRNLMGMQEQLKGTNVELDRKVDELARTNLALYESNRLKSDFLATMSHELRTPLNSILGFSELLLANTQLPEKTRRWAGNIQASGKQLLALINDLLDLAKIEAGKMDVKLEDVPLAEMAEGLIATLKPISEKKNIDLRMHIDPDLPRIRQDVVKLRQILSNLLTNAIKFTPEGGRVVLRAEAEGSELVLTVTDNGVGIAREDQELIFDKFRQAASPMTREHEGTGLGLSIVRELTKLLGGDVTLQSELGRGSTFTVRLPLELSDAPQVKYEPPPGMFGDGPDSAPVSSLAPVPS